MSFFKIVGAILASVVILIAAFALFSTGYQAYARNDAEQQMDRIHHQMHCELVRGTRMDDPTCH
jgi:uncharacterized membrane protein